MARDGSPTPIEIETVLIVDDETDLAALYTMWLADDYETRTANSAETALRALDGEVDAIILDRWMPTESGDEVLPRIRNAYPDVLVVMVTAVDPDFDVIDLDIDAYLTKPVSRSAVLETLDALNAHRQRGPDHLELFSLVSKRAFLRARASTSELEAHAVFRTLDSRIEELTGTPTGPRLDDVVPMDALDGWGT